MAVAKPLPRKGEYVKAIERFSVKLISTPDDKNFLASRSACFLKLGDTKRALTDAESSLKKDMSFYRGMYCKGEALFAMGEFESALVWYNRAYKERKNLKECKLGIQKAKEAIENDVDRVLHSSMFTVKEEDREQVTIMDKELEILEKEYIEQNKTKKHKHHKKCIKPCCMPPPDPVLDIPKPLSESRQPCAREERIKTTFRDDTWYEERERLINQKLKLAGKLTTAESRIKFLEKQMKAAANELNVKKQRTDMDNCRTEYLEKRMRAAANELKIGKETTYNTYDNKSKKPLLTPLSEQKRKELLWTTYAPRYNKARRHNPPPMDHYEKALDQSKVLQDEYARDAIQKPLGEKWPQDRRQREVDASYRNVPVTREDQWQKEKDDLLETKQTLTGLLWNTQQRIKHIEEQIKAPAKEVRKEVSQKHDMANKLLAKELTGAKNGLRTKQVHWDKELTVMQEHFRRELAMQETAFERERREILGEKHRLVKERKDASKKLTYTESVITNIEQQLLAAEQKLQERQKTLLINLHELERNFIQMESMQERSRVDLKAKQGDILQQLFLTKLNVQSIN